MDAIEMSGITKRYGNLLANDRVDLRIRRGGIHAVVGENGAGKSTLMNVLYGLIQPDEGKVSIAGRLVRFRDPAEAIAHGIGMVHQHLRQVPSYSVLENVILGREPRTPWGTLDRGQAMKAIGDLSSKFGLGVDLNGKVRDLSLGMRQRVEIIKLLYRGAEIIILDEPTANLSPQGTEELLAVLRELNQTGKTIIFISHKLPEVLAIANSVTVMRKGRVVATIETKNASEDELVALMIGEHSLDVVRTETHLQDTVLQLDKLVVEDATGSEAVKNISFSVRGGEIVAIAGVEGNGQTELAEAVIGFLPIKAGTIRLRGVDVAGMNVLQRRQLGMAFIPEDRTEAGLVLAASLSENAVLGVHCRRKPIARGQLINWRAASAFASALGREYGIKFPGPPHLTLAGSLSGGNMQKLLLGRELASEARCLIVSQPTQGLDIGAKKAVYDGLLGRRAEACGILLLSTDLDEIFEIADRILVIYKRELTAALAADSTTPYEVGQYMTGMKRSLPQ